MSTLRRQHPVLKIDAMRRWATSFFVLAIGSGPAWSAPTTDPFANDAASGSGISIMRPAAEPSAQSGPPPQTGNPLWAVPLSALSATQERPVFTPSRRPPPRAVAAAPVFVPPPPPPPPAPPEPLQLALIGAVVGDGDAIAVFLDRTTQGIVRMRAGQNHAGWSLTTIAPRGATLTRNGQTETVELQRNGDANSGGFGGQGIAAGLGATGSLPPGMMISPATGAIMAIPGAAPFVPRSTPRNGASDGM